MKKKYFYFLSCSLLLGMSAFPSRLAHSDSENTSLRMSRALIGIQDAAISFLTGKTGDRALVETMKRLASEEPQKEFIGIDKAIAKSLYSTWHDWQITRNPEARDKFLDALDTAKQHYRPYEVPPEANYLWKYIQFDLKGSTPEENALLKTAAEDSQWIMLNLNGVANLTPECKENLAALDRAVTDFSATGDPKILQTLASDLRTKVLHCQETGTRADQTTTFTFDTEDIKKMKMDGWAVYARPATNPNRKEKLLGSSSPVTNAKLMAGRWLFYAVNSDGQESIWREVIVHKGSVDPVSFWIQLP